MKFQVYYSNAATRAFDTRVIVAESRSDAIRRIAATVNPGWKFSVSKRPIREQAR